MITHVLVGQIQELLELDSTVGEGAERSPLLNVSSDLGIGNVSVSLCVQHYQQLIRHRTTSSIAHHVECW